MNSRQWEASSRLRKKSESAFEAGEGGERKDWSSDGVLKQ